jgi:hypothetical protein
LKQKAKVTTDDKDKKEIEVKIEEIDAKRRAMFGTKLLTDPDPGWRLVSTHSGRVR